MNTVQKFNKFNKKIYNSFDVLKNHFLQKNPIKFVDNTTDYTQVYEYYGKYEYVFLVKNGTTLIETFPLWLKPSFNELNVAYEFPVVFKKTGNIKSWGEVTLVPANGIVTEVKRKSIIASMYDVYRGKDKFDVFYVGSANDTAYQKLTGITENPTVVSSIYDAYSLSTTDMFWVIPNTVKIDKDFKFDYVPNERASDYIHVFGNGELSRHDGIILASKSYVPDEVEVKNNFYAKKRIVRQIVSHPL